MTAYAPPREDCAPRKLTGSRLLECKSRPKIPKLVFTAPDFVSENCTFVIFVNLRRISFKFWDEDLFLFGLHFRFREKSQEFWDDNQNLWKFWDEDLFFFFWSSPFSFDPYSNKLLVPPKISVCPPPPPPPVTLSWSRAWLEQYIRKIFSSNCSTNLK